MNKHEKSYSLSDTINWVSMIHKNQVRKGTDMPYISHVFGVSALLMTHGISDEEIIKTALLHDVVEDSDVTLETIENIFGKTISDYVDWLSEDKATSWEHRKQYSIAHIKDMPIEVKWVKLADKVNSLEMMHGEVISSGIDWNKFNRGYVVERHFTA
jgi:(p)ppGpp synthase/HD superfamily hydrolase